MSIDFNNVVDLKERAGRKLPPSGGDWLSELDEGTVFLCRPKQSIKKPGEQEVPVPFLREFTVFRKVGKAIQLSIGMEHEELAWTDPQIFCNMMDLFQVIEVPKNVEPTE